jgi:hypothetical protein
MMLLYIYFIRHNEVHQQREQVLGKKNSSVILRLLDAVVGLYVLL